MLQFIAFLYPQTYTIISQFIVSFHNTKSATSPHILLFTLNMHLSGYITTLALSGLTIVQQSFARSFSPLSQAVLSDSSNIGHNELYLPSLDRPVPGKIPFKIDESIHYFARHVNGSENGQYRRSSCPAVNTLANRGYINRSGRNISYEEIAQASREVWNFGDDNVTNSSKFILALSLELTSADNYGSCAFVCSSSGSSQCGLGHVCRKYTSIISSRHWAERNHRMMLCNT